jgi:hypothetical protein
MYFYLTIVSKQLLFKGQLLTVKLLQYFKIKGNTDITPKNAGSKGEFALKNE